MNIDLTMFIALLGFAVALTNVSVEVIKKVTWDKLPTNIIVLFISEILSFTIGLLYIMYNQITFNFYSVIAFIFIGFMIAYAAMFGFDKLKEVMNWKNKS